MRKISLLLLILISLVSLTSCSNSSTDDSSTVDSFYFDPKQPGINVNDDTIVRGVFNVKICPNINDPTCPEDTANDYNNKAHLSWKIPSLYETEKYSVAIYKVHAVGDYEDFQLGDMPDLGSMNFEQIRVVDTQWTDENILQNTQYYYWVFLILGGETTLFDISTGLWSSSQRYSILTPLEGSILGDTNSYDFWEKIRWDNLTTKPQTGGDDPVLTWNTASPGSPEVDLPKGGIETAYNGSVIFMSDTDNNRIIIFENQQLRTCEDFVDDDLQYFACRLQAAGAPPNSRNILGQPSQSMNLSCQEHDVVCQGKSSESECLADQNNIKSFCRWDSNSNSCHVKGSDCLTQPTELLFHDGKLLVSDTGNNRVIMYSSVEYNPNPSNPSTSEVLIGCDNRLPDQTRDTNPVKCSFDKVFGKKTLNDLTDTYNLEGGDGISILSNPTGLAIKNNDLYIADTKHNRIVKVKEFDDPSSYWCDENNWLTSFCSWHGLLGQPDYFSNKTFKDFYNEDSGIMGGTFLNEIESNPNMLKRYFRNPTKILFKTFNGVDYTFVATNEDFKSTTPLGIEIALRGRILRYDNFPIEDDFPSCNEATFSVGNCDVSEIIGQITPEKLIILSGSTGGAGSYKNLSYGIDNINDMDFLNNELLAIDSTHNVIYVWKDILDDTNEAFPYSFKIEDPEGVYISDNIILPDLKQIQSLDFDGSDKLFILDGLEGKTFQLNFEQIPFE